MYREITLKNNVIVLSVPFVHHTELQNFLIAPRINKSEVTINKVLNSIRLCVKAKRYIGLRLILPLDVTARSHESQFILHGDMDLV